MAFQVPIMQNLDALRRSVNAIFATLTATGATAARPASPAVGQPFFDTTIGLPIWWNGSHWINAAGTVV